ncbi:MAG TPA: ATP-binding protein, partial [Solirubrobacteraceae bacterium]|nr:ATP-binding protein [Solirubrobacteraceae bacterium]
MAPRTFGALLAERRAALVGRDAELAALLGVLEDDGPLAAIVHGVAGAGKSALLRAFRAEAVARGAAVVAIDGRAIEPTEHGFRAALDAGLAAQEGPEHVRRVLVVDAAERLRLIEGWLRGELLPSLPAHVRVVLATRDAPGAVWRASFGELLRTVPLGPLDPAGAVEVLRRAGLDDRQAAWVNRFTRGHPLSLQLAASALHARPDAPEDAILPTVVQELAALYLDGLDAATREALDATSVLRRVTLSLLGALVPGPPQEAFARLSALPFVELGREGLVVHDTVREAVLALLRAADPVRHRAYRAAAWRQIRSEMAGAAAGEARWASVADMLALVEEPLVREAFFPASVQHYAVERARPEDRDAIEAIAARHEAPEEVALVGAWWESVPQAFRVARDPRGRVVAFTVLAVLGDVPRRLLDADPVCEPWRRHLAEHPVPGGQQVLLARQ